VNIAAGRYKDVRFDHPKVFFAATAAFGPKNLIWAASTATTPRVDPQDESRARNTRAPPPKCTSRRRDGHHEWSLRQRHLRDKRYKVPHRDRLIALKEHPHRGSNSAMTSRLALGEAQTLPELRRADGGLGARGASNATPASTLPMDCINFTENGEKADCESGCA